MIYIRAWYVANANDDSNTGSKSIFFNDHIDKEWNDNFRREFNIGLPSKEGLGNIITFDVKDYATDVKNYLTIGLRDHFVRLVKNYFQMINTTISILQRCDC